MTVHPQAPPVDAKPLDPGLIDSVIRGVRYTLSGVSPSTWFGPGQPVQPYAQQVKGRQFDFPVGFNYRITPRGEEAVSFDQLRSLADSYYLLRLVIETRKDQMVKLKSDIRCRDDKKPDASDLTRIAEIKAALRYPDREHTFQTWMRAVIEDVLVIDAPAIEPRKTLTGEPYSLDLVDGATITRRIDEFGRTPAPPDPAYQQILHGIPAVDLSTDDLLYMPRNKRTNKLYGFSPVEQMIYIVNIGLRRDVSKLQYYTEGSIPDMIGLMPEGWATEQIKEFQQYWDSLLEGNTAFRRKARFIPAVEKLEFTKPELLKDQYDDYLVRVVCYAFSVSPNALVQAVNKGTGQTVQEAALEEGLYPLMLWFKDLMDLILAKYFNQPDYEWIWSDEIEEDVVKRATANKLNIEGGVRTINSVKEAEGEDTVPGGDIPFIVTSGGVFLITEEGLKPVVGGAAPGGFAPTGPAPAPKLTAPPAAPKPPQSSAPKPGEAATAGEGPAVEKRGPKVLRTAKAPSARRLALAVGSRIERLLKHEGSRLAHTISNDVPDLSTPSRLKKVAGDDDAFDEVNAGIVADGIEFGGWSVIVSDMEDALEEVGRDTVRIMLARLGMADNVDAVNRANDAVVEYARTRSAELVGMRRTAEGGLVPNPNASMAITETTRNDIQRLITQAVEDGMTRAELRDAIMEAGAFGADRAAMIAHTELSFANANANWESWKASGAVSKKRWLKSDDHAIPDECDLNEEAGDIPLDEPFPSGDMMHPAHPNCECDVAAVMAEELDTAPDGGDSETEGGLTEPDVEGATE